MPQQNASRQCVFLPIGLVGGPALSLWAITNYLVQSWETVGIHFRFLERSWSTKDQRNQQTTKRSPNSSHLSITQCAYKDGVVKKSTPPNKMGSMRGLWVISLEPSPHVVFSRFDPISPHVLMSRRFPTVERRAKILHAKHHTTIPPDKEWCDILIGASQGRKVNLLHNLHPHLEIGERRAV